VTRLRGEEFIELRGNTVKRREDAATGVSDGAIALRQAEETLLKAGALQNAIFNSANFSSIATDAKGVIQIFNVGAERMLGYAAAPKASRLWCSRPHAASRTSTN